jgi:transcriptional regulator with XRE-family HTH domain
MQNLLLLHLREQRGLTVKQIEQTTGIPGSRYMEYEQGSASISNADCELLSCLLKVKPIYLNDYSRQLEYFTYAKSMLELKDKRIEELVTVLKLYIEKESKQKSSKPKHSASK